MERQPTRYLIDTRGPDPEAIRNAFRILANFSDAHPDLVKNAMLLTSTKQNLQNPVPLQAIGHSRVAKLLSGSGLRLPNGALLKHATLRTLPVYPQPDAVIVLYATQKTLNYVDDLGSLQIVIVIPWSPEDVREWRSTWSPIVYGEQAQGVPPHDVSPVVAEALKDLTAMVNLGTGLSHPSDKAAARDTLWILFSNGEWSSPSLMRAWAVRNGWTTSGADDLRAIAERIERTGRKPRGAGSFLWQDIIERWREAAKGR